MKPWDKSLFTCLFSEEQIRARIAEMGREISRDYREKEGELIIVAMLRGSMYFVADLTRAIDLPLTFDFYGIESFAKAGGAGAIKITKDLDVDISGKHVLVLEEVVRTGLTTNYMLQNLELRNPASIALAAMLANEQQQLIDLPLKYVGFPIDYTRALGYGMDFQDRGRNLPFICELIKDQILAATAPEV